MHINVLKIGKLKSVGGSIDSRPGVAFSKASHVGSIQRSSVTGTHGGMPLDTIVRPTV